MIKKYILGFLGILVIVLIGIAVINPLISNNDNKVFENQFIKFNYSSNLNIVDYSNNTTLLVIIYDGNITSNQDINAVGTIRVAKNNLKNLNVNTTNKIKFKNVTISGYKAIVEYDQLDSGAIIYLNNSAVLCVLLNNRYDSYVDTILNSFVIKKVPSQLTILNKTTN